MNESPVWGSVETRLDGGLWVLQPVLSGQHYRVAGSSNRVPSRIVTYAEGE